VPVSGPAPIAVGGGGTEHPQPWGDAEKARTEKARTENAAQKCRGGNGEALSPWDAEKAFTFLAHLQRTTDNETEIQRLDRGLRIRRAKKRSNLVNDARIKVCINR